jgi:mRNA-degrading endonuclease RelE of RelBE toxin-antitoxin system
LKNIEFDRGLLEQLRALPKGQRREVGELIAAVQAAFGQPHQHAGAGLRKLRHRHYEIRLSLDQRLVFEDRGDALHFKILGNHDDVKRFLRRLR